MTVTKEGYVRKRFDDYLTELSSLFQEKLGPINTNPDSVCGVLINLFSYALSTMEEKLQGVYDSAYPSTAEGISLDGAVSYVGIERLPSAPTTVAVTCYGKEGSVVSKGAIVSSLSGYQFLNTKSIVISRSNAVEVQITVSEVQKNSNYIISLNGSAYEYEVESDITKEELLQNLSNLIPESYRTKIENETLKIYSLDNITPFACYCSSLLKLEKIGSVSYFDCSENGSIYVPVGDITKIVSQLSGWEEVYNQIEGDTGRDRETDIELRDRFNSSNRIAGASTSEAIKSNIKNDVPTVQSVRIYENKKNIEVDGMPAHSYECVVYGGLDQEVADAIYKYKPSGIETYGNVSKQVVDINGDATTIRFSRVSDVEIYVKVTVISLNEEETLSESIETAIKTAVVNYGNSLEIGDDVLYQRFYGPIFDGTSGLEQIKIEIATKVEGEIEYGEKDIEILRTEKALFSLENVTVEGV